MHRNTDQSGDHAVDVAERRGLNRQAQRQHHRQNTEAGDQGEERFRHCRRHAVRHADNEIAAGDQTINLRRQQRNDNSDKQPLAADHAHRDHPFNHLRRAVYRGKQGVLRDSHHKGHQRHRPGAQRVDSAVLLRQPIGDAEAGNQRHNVVGRFHRVQHFIAPDLAKQAAHHVGIAGDRQVGENQEKRANQHKRHIQNDAIAYRQDVLLPGDFQRRRHDVTFNPACIRHGVLPREIAVS